MNTNLIIAGFGGQGVLMLGNILVTAAMNEGKHVTWMPSYGPEMRGGTANCTVVISDNEIGSPVIGHPYNVIAFNLPSKQKFESNIKKDGLLIVNTSLIEDKAKRNDINVLYAPLNKMADGLGEPRCLNIVALGAFLELTNVISKDHALNAIESSFKRKPEVIDVNKKALEAGIDFVKQNSHFVKAC